MFAFYFLRSMESQIIGNAGAAFASINKHEIEAIAIPLPPLEVQQEIVAEIEGYQKVIDGARAVVENYRPHIAVDQTWPMVELREAAVNNWGNTNRTKSSFVEDGPFLGVFSSRLRRSNGPCRA